MQKKMHSFAKVTSFFLFKVSIQFYFKNFPLNYSQLMKNKMRTLFAIETQSRQSVSNFLCGLE